MIQAYTDFESSLFHLIIFCLKELNIKALIKKNFMPNIVLSR